MMQLRSGKLLFFRNNVPPIVSSKTPQPLVGYKKARDNRLIILEIPEKARHNIERPGVFNKQFAGHRCSFAFVREIIDLDTGKNLEQAVSTVDLDVIYNVGKMVHPRNGFDENLTNVSGGGIHFFLDRECAEMYGKKTLWNGTIKIWNDNGTLKGIKEFKNGKSAEDALVFSLFDFDWFSKN